MAVDQYQTLSAKSPERMEYRFDYGKALIFNDQYKDAADILHGVPDAFCCGRIRVAARLFEAAALFGESRPEQANNVLCKGLAEWPKWKKWLEGDSDEGHSSEIRDKLRKLISSDVWQQSCPS
jgi:hypothetical protein